MRWREWLEKWSMTSLKIKTPFLETEWHPKDKDKDAAWELYIELLTRIATQPLPNEHGDESTALESIHKLFGLTREIIREHGRECIEFTKIAVIVLNQVIRPFTAKWHKESLANAFADSQKCDEFRKELVEIQSSLINYAKMLSDMAGVEDLTELENRNGQT
ncbi:MAG TPA: hypothetical protein PLY86_18150 [bacterium]|nr:hypothetical protein [bacterium]